ncbi:hypothetical protein J4T77_04395 [Wolbachia endosymbiont of Drosophila innubila]|nr:hypothetical protein [Wolbachia endosymbiont of Drosophila innubila]UID80993.1 hypothetical protein J4T77_04395 [Wolbachia endosymbiont of Drosophila innubila]
MSSSINKQLVMDSLLMAVNKRKPAKIYYYIVIKVHNILRKVINISYP